MADKVAATYHPNTHTCEWCGHVWGNRWSAATCCDEVTNSSDD